MQRFSPYDLTQNVATISNINAGNAQGAKPWAADISAGYNFNAWDKAQNVYVGYEASNNAVNINLPRQRYEAGYGVDVLKNTNVGVALAHDVDYGASNGGTNKSNNRVGVRVGVKFG
jgi:hypothetical protein